MRAAAPVACVAQPMGEWVVRVVRVVAVQTDRACELTVTVVTVGVRRVRAAAAARSRNWTCTAH